MSDLEIEDKSFDKKNSYAGIKVLIIDDQQYNIDALRPILENWGLIVDGFNSPKKGLEAFKQNDYSLVICDLMMPKINGIDLMRKILTVNPRQDVIIITAFGDIDKAVEAIKAGAYDFINKPLNIDLLYSKIKRVAEKEELKKQIEMLRSTKPSSEPIFDMFKGRSKAIADIIEKISRISNTNATVLLTGESGTGKELIAKLITETSSRKDKPLLAINCGSLTTTLLENELFGHVKGAYTGAHKTKRGLFEEADGGTILLDEIGEIDPQMQISLLRILQEGEIKPVGSNEIIKVDVRIIASTNKDLQEEIVKRKFRDDLFYRLNVISIHIPPLRERLEDIPLLGDHFLKIYREKYNKNIKGFEQAAIKSLMNYSWPGNVRELENIIESAVILSMNEVITAHDLAFPPVKTTKVKTRYNFQPQPYSKAKMDFEKDYAKKLLILTNGNVKRASQIAHKDRKDFYSMMKRCGISPTDFR